jgi:MFS family permease
MADDEGATELNPPFSVLRHPPVLLLWVSRVASMIAFQMQGVAFGWQMYALTDSTLDLGLIGLFQFVPAAMLALVAGQVADRYDRSLVLRLAQMVEAIAALMMLTATAAGIASREWIFAAAFIVGSARAFEGTAFQTVLPVIVPQGHLTRAIAALASAQQIATVGGPALGGLLYVFGATLVYGLCCTLFLTAATCMLFIETPRAATMREPVTLRNLFAGSAYITRNPIIFGAISLDLSRCRGRSDGAAAGVRARRLRTGPWGLGRCAPRQRSAHW